MPIQFIDFPASGSAFFQDQLPLIKCESDFMTQNGNTWEPTEDNLSSIIRIYDVFGNTWPNPPQLPDAIAELEAPYSSQDGLAKFRISELFDFKIVEKIPQFWNSFRSNQRFSKEVAVRLFDKVGSPPEIVPPDIDSPNTFTLVHGRSPRQNGTPDLNTGRTFFVAHNYARYINALPQHRWARKRVHVNQPEWVYIYNNDVQRLVDLSMKVYYDDGNVEVFDLDNADLYPRSHTVLNLGWRYIFEELIPTATLSGTVVNYDLMLGIDGVTTVIPYELVSRPHLWNAFILHYNGMSGYETMWLSGKQKETTQSNQREYSRYDHATGPFSPLSDAVNFDFVQHNRFTRPSIEINSGWMDDYSFPLLRQLLHGPCFLCDIARKQFVKVSFPNSELSGPPDDESTHKSATLQMNFDQKDFQYNQPNQNYPTP